MDELRSAHQKNYVSFVVVFLRLTGQRNPEVEWSKEDRNSNTVIININVAA